MILILGIAAIASTVGLLVAEPIVAPLVDWLARRVPGSGMLLDGPANTRMLRRLVAADRATVLDAGGPAESTLVLDGFGVAKPLTCSPCASWWTAWVGVVAALLVFDPGPACLVAPFVAWPVTIAVDSLRFLAERAGPGEVQ